MKFVGLVFLSVMCVCVGARTLSAQETISYGTISGQVTDAQGAVVPGATATAWQIDTNLSRETVTDREGRFRFPYLRVGRYQVVVRLVGFANVSRNVTVTVGSAFELPLMLTVAGLDTSLTVSAEATVLEAARSQIASTVSQEEVMDVPLNGRNFLDLALLVPGVSPTNTGSTQLFAETSAVLGQGLSIGSQRNLSNNFIVDGLSANDDAAGFSGIPYGVDAVDQFQVVTSGGQAELGRSLGGYVNIVTKSGTNTPHGDLYGYFRDDRFNGRNALSRTKLPMSQQQYGASMGGPLVRDRTFYFSNFEERRLDQTGLVTIAPDNVNVINARLAAMNYTGLPVSTGIYANPVHSANVLGKVDHQFSVRDQVSVRYSLYNVTSSNSRGVGGLNAPSGSAGLDNIDQAVAVGNTLTLSTRTVMETRAQFAYSDLQAPSTDPVGPTVNIAGVAVFGAFQSSPTLRVNKLYQVVNNLSHQRGAHALRAGVDFLYNDDTIANPGARRGSYAFSSLANFLAGTYNNAGFTQAFGETTIAQQNPNVGVYAQDEWKVNPSLTVNAGLRYDLQFLETIATDTNNISPRLGLAWSPSASGRTIVRGSVGLFYDRVPLRAVANALLSAGNSTDLTKIRRVSIGLSPTQDGAPAFPNILSASVSTVALVNLTTMDPNMTNGYTRQGSVEVEQQLGPQGTVSVGYQYSRGANLIMAVNQNVPTCVAAGSNNGCRPNPNYANNSRYSPAASSRYHGLHVSLVQRPARWGHYRVSYTLSKSLDNVGQNFFSSPIDAFDLSKDWGRSDNDQRHRLVVSGAINTSTDPAETPWERLTHGFQVTGMLQSYSSLPFNITSGVATVQGTAGRPIVNGEFIERNAGIGSDFFTLNVRVSRSFRIVGSARVEAAAEAFNLTNRRNAITRNTNFGSGTYPTNAVAGFGDVTAVGDPRTLQLAIRVGF
jgi:outer membrane receptor protein involved in Fe transport